MVRTVFHEAVHAACYLTRKENEYAWDDTDFPAELEEGAADWTGALSVEMLRALGMLRD